MQSIKAVLACGQSDFSDSSLAPEVQVHRVYLNDPSLESLDFGCFHVPRGPNIFH